METEHRWQLNTNRIFHFFSIYLSLFFHQVKKEHIVIIGELNMNRPCGPHVYEYERAMNLDHAEISLYLFKLLFIVHKD